MKTHEVIQMSGKGFATHDTKILNQVLCWSEQFYFQKIFQQTKILYMEVRMESGFNLSDFRSTISIKHNIINVNK